MLFQWSKAMGFPCDWRLPWGQPPPGLRVGEAGANVASGDAKTLTFTTQMGWDAQGMAAQLGWDTG